MNNIINISEKNKDAMVNLERFIYSLTMKLDGIKDIYTKVCPSCGGKEISIINDEYSCDKCRCIWSFVLKNDNDQIWVKRFGK